MLSFYAIDEQIKLILLFLKIDDLMSNAGVKVYFYFYFSKITSYCSYFMIGLRYKFTILVRVKMVLILKCTFQAATKIAGINFDKVAVERLDRMRNKMHL